MLLEEVRYWLKIDDFEAKKNKVGGERKKDTEEVKKIGDSTWEKAKSKR